MSIESWIGGFRNNIRHIIATYVIVLKVKYTGTLFAMTMDGDNGIYPLDNVIVLGVVFDKK